MIKIIIFVLYFIFGNFICGNNSIVVENYLIYITKIKTEKSYRYILKYLRAIEILILRVESLESNHHKK